MRAGGRVHDDHAPAAVLIRHGRFVHENDMAGAVAGLDLFLAPRDEIPGPGVAQTLDALPR